MKKAVFLLSLFVALSCSCSKDNDNIDEYNKIDKVYPVYIKISDSAIEDGKYYEFFATDSTKVGKGGVAFINKKAYDLACPIEWNNNETNRVEEVQTGINQGMFKCNKCGSVFNRFGPEAYSGIAKEKKKDLKRYKVTQKTDGSWLITN